MSHKAWALLLVGLITLALLLAACSTPEPIPISLAPTPAYTAKLEMQKEGMTVGGQIPFFLWEFSKDGKDVGGVMTNLASTKFDVSSLGSRDTVTIAIQSSPSRTSDVTVKVNIKDIDSFYISEDYVVFLPNKPAIEKKGPFIRLRFQTYTTSLDKWSVTLEQEGHKVKAKLSKDGVFDLANVKPAPIRCTLKNPSSSGTYEYTVYPKIRSAVNGLVVYEIKGWWNR